MKEGGSVVLETELIWLDLVRDTNLARTVGSRVIDNGQRISCMWTSARLGMDGAVLDVDRCLPWSAWHVVISGTC